ncbi:c-type cytochrome [Rhodobacterales bacterium HKCCE3408]|nr:c-type cytochrome [Rhodobacterales bacterium HKCCE3408]
MFDTMTITKIGGGFLGAFLIFLLAGWAADGIYSTASGHGEGHEAGWSIEVASSEDAAPAEAEPEVPFEEVFASADASAGERVFRQCSGCHAVEEGRNGVGPSLYGVVGRDIASISDFSYSDALSGLEGAWTPEEISHFIANPRDYAPGTAMSYNGLSDIEDRANVIAYLESVAN